MNLEGQLRQAWYEAHQELRAWLEQWTYIDKARAIASAVCALWVRHSLDGRQFVTGPYGGLYAAAYETAKLTIGGVTMPETRAAEATIPLDQSMLPYQLCKLYVDIWKAGQLLHWDRKTANRATRAISLLWPSSPTGFALLGTDMVNPLAWPLLRRALETLEQHKCLDCDICSQGTVRWEGADMLTEKWTNHRRLERQERSCQTEGN